MLRKVLDLIKVTSIMWICMLLPLLIGFSSIKSASKTDVIGYMDSYVENESMNLAKYVSLQLKNTGKDILEISDSIILNYEDGEEGISKVLNETLRDNINIVDVNIYNEKGGIIQKSREENDQEFIDVHDYAIADLKNKDITFSFEQNEDDGEILVNFILKRDRVSEEIDPFYLRVTMKWSQYENFLDRLQDGVFSRHFYIISPDCERFISYNALPKGAERQSNSIALGWHLSKNLKNISTGSSDIKLENLPYRVFKTEIKCPEKMDGSQLYIISVTDEDSFEMLSKGIFKNISYIIVILLIVLLIVCLVVSRFLNKAKEQVKISDAISESTPSAIIVFDSETGKIQKINPSGLTLARLPADKINLVNAWDLFTSEKDRNYILNAMKNNINIMNYEVLVQSYAGNTFWSICSANALIMDIEMESKLYVVLSILDINKRKEIEKKLANNAELLEKQVAERTADLEVKAKELEETNKKLDQAKIQADSANAAKSKFLTNMSVEFKTPVNAIIGYSEILREEALDRKDNVSADDLTKIIGSAKHLLSLINEILDLSSIESGKTQLLLETVGIPDLVKEVEGVSMPLITKNENTLLCECPKDIGDMFIDQTKLRQCLLNLIDNSAKFTEFGKITLRVKPIVTASEDFIEFEVIDTGTGIEADKLDNIFASFQESTQDSGAGLGLSITKKYIECMGGTISVESEFGVGSKFIIRVPRTCKVESNEFVEVKSHRDDDADVFDDQFVYPEEENQVTEETFTNEHTVTEEKTSSNVSGNDEYPTLTTKE